MNREKLIALAKDKFSLSEALLLSESDESLRKILKYRAESFYLEEELKRLISTSILKKEDILAIRGDFIERIKSYLSEKEFSEELIEKLSGEVDLFFTKVEKSTLPLLNDAWHYVLILTEKSITLSMRCIGLSVDLDDHYNKKHIWKQVTADYPLIVHELPMLSVNDYSALYGVEAVTVRQWIRRGKLRTAYKNEKEWLIPFLCELPKSKRYAPVCYTFKNDEIVFPAGFEFLKAYDYILISATEESLSLFHLEAYKNVSNDEVFNRMVKENISKEEAMRLYERKEIITKKEKELLELFCIQHKDISCNSELSFLYEQKA